jgi:protein kinase C substrate 80K-H
MALVLAASLVSPVFAWFGGGGASAPLPVRPRHLVGVPTSLEARFSSPTFTCLDGAGAALPLASVNDNYCDCADGSDEPGTSACASGRFWCANVGFTEKTLPASRVGDGVCDCCDGSDEAPAGAPSPSRCRNTCDADGASWRAAAAEAARVAAEGRRARAGMAAAGAAAAAARDAALGAARATLTTARAKREAAEAVEAPHAAAEAAAAAAARDAAAADGGLAVVERDLGLGGVERAEVLKLLVDVTATSNSGAGLMELVKERGAAGTLSLGA